MHIKLEKNQRKSAKRAQHIFTVNFKRQLGYLQATTIVHEQAVAEMLRARSIDTR